MYKHRCVATQRIVAIAAVMVFSAQFVTALQLLPQTPLSDSGEVKDAKQAFALLEHLAKDAVSTDSNLGRTRVSLADGILTYDFQPAPETSLTSRPSRLTDPLELLIRIEALARDFHSCFPTQTFWNPSLDRLRGLASSMVEEAFHTVSENEWRSRRQEYKDRVGQEFSVLTKETLIFAKSAGLDVNGARGSVSGYEVEVRINPPKGHIRFMPFLDYMRCNAFKLNLKDYWVDLNAGTHTLIGRYHYLEEWPASLGVSREDNFEITREGMKLTFEPEEK